MFARAASWVAIARAALPRRPVRRRDVTSATMIGVLMSATLPARLGEPARAMVLARRVGRMRETFAVLIGTLVSQTALNILALVMLGGDHRLHHRPLPVEHPEALPGLDGAAAAPGGGAAGAVAGEGERRGPGRPGTSGAIRSALKQARQGLASSATAPQGHVRRRSPSSAPGSCSCSPAGRSSPRSGLDHQVGIGAAAACLFAVNVTAVVPATPSNIGIFQLAVISVLTRRLRRLRRRRARLRRDPAGGRDRDRRRPRRPGPGARGRHLVGHAPARALRRAGAPLGAPARSGSPLEPRPRAASPRRRPHTSRISTASLA